MNDTSLTEEELEVLLGDKAGDDSVFSNTSNEIKTEDGNSSLLTESIKSALPLMKSEFSQKIGEEITIQFSGVEQCHKIAVDISGKWYSAKGSFSNNGDHCEHVMVYSDSLAHELAKRITGIDDIENSIESVANPLKELSENMLKALSNGFGSEFSGIIGDFSLSEDLGKIPVTGDFLRAEFSIDDTVFYYFFSVTILDLLNTDEDDDFSSLLSGGSWNNDEKTQSKSSNSQSAFTSAMSSAGDALLKGDASISDVEFPAFDEGEAKQASGGKRIDMLMDVQVDVSVELGSTQRTVEEILNLGQGTIIDLNKLAGEPLDIKVNNKLIAKGEVVVIDENFGVRIVGILSPKERISGS